MALPDNVQDQIRKIFTKKLSQNPRELLERNRSRLRVCAAVFDGLHYANPKCEMKNYIDVLKDVSEYITDAYHDLEQIKADLHIANMKLMKQEAKLSGLRVALAHTQNYAKSAIKQKKAAAEKTVANLEKFVAAELKKSELEE